MKVKFHLQKVKFALQKVRFALLLTLVLIVAAFIFAPKLAQLLKGWLE